MTFDGVSRFDYDDFDEQDDIYFSLKINAATVDVEELTRYNL